MKKKKYSKVYKGDADGYGYRYNYTDCALEAVSKERFDEEKMEFVPTRSWTPYDSIGLSVESWKDNPEGWIEEYAQDLNEQCNYEIANEFREYIRSSSAGDYSPGNPWDAPGMSIRDFI